MFVGSNVSADSRMAAICVHIARADALRASGSLRSDPPTDESCGMISAQAAVMMPRRRDGRTLSPAPTTPRSVPLAR